MPKVLSLDLRERVVAAVSAGMSSGQAAARFGVSLASAVRWCALQRNTGSLQAKPQGGDRHSHRIEAQAPVIMSLLEQTCDITLMELQAELDARGHHFGIGTLWRFFDRHAMTWKKNGARQRARAPRHRAAPPALAR